MRLQRLSADAERLLTPEFVFAQQAVWPDDSWERLVSPFERVVSLDNLFTQLDALVKTYRVHDTALDRAVAPALHRSLALTRREASDIGIFRYLAVIARPDVVRHRWEAATFSTARDRFWKVGTRPDSNAFGRWWWIAELSRRGTDYSLTERLLNNGALTTKLFVRGASWFFPFVQAAVEVLEEVDGATIEVVLTRLQEELGTKPLEAMSVEALRSALRRFL